MNELWSLISPDPLRSHSITLSWTDNQYQITVNRKQFLGICYEYNGAGILCGNAEVQSTYFGFCGSLAFFPSVEVWHLNDDACAHAAGVVLKGKSLCTLLHTVSCFIYAVGKPVRTSNYDL